MSSNPGRFWLGIALIAVGTFAVFGLKSVGSSLVPILGIAAVALLTVGTVLAGTSTSTESGAAV